MSSDTVRQAVEETRLIVILRRVPAEKLLPLASCLMDAGVRCIEVTYDHALPDCCAVQNEALRALTAHFPELLPGAGTVLTAEEARLAAECGARYIISPDTDAAVIAETKRLGLLSMPGAYTPTEIKTAYGLGADYVKLFPADVGGPAYVRAVRAPLCHIPLLAVGGVTPETIPAFLAAGIRGFGVSSGIVRHDLLEKDDYRGIAALAAQYIEACKESKNI